MKLTMGVEMDFTAAQSAPANSPLHVLLVGQREEDFFLVRDLLARAGSTLTAELDHALCLDEARTMLLQGCYSLVLFEYDAGDSATQLLTEFFNTGTSVPVIVLAEDAGEMEIARILERGASACLEKSQLNNANLVRTIRSTLAWHSLQQEHQSAEDALRKLSRAVEGSADAIVITNRTGIIEYVNPAFEALTGYSHEEVIGQTPGILKSGEQAPEIYQELWQTILAGKIFRGILVNRKKNGEFYYVEESISPVRDSAGCITHFIANGRDLTDRLRLEAQLLQAQKMDAVGRLAGGVAHDFNNLLTIITSYSELALDSVGPGTALEGKLSEILSAARRAAQLTRQLLAFSRKQPQALRVVDLNNVVAEITRTLQRLIGEDIQLTFHPGTELGQVRVDPFQIEQILMNLAVNARDAMPQGGQLKIETSNVILGDEYIHRKHVAIPPGQYVLISVSDTGKGIPADHLAHIFEPFYTTKPVGKGTGLGLATVYGIVKQNRGFIWAYSEPDMGTVFKVYLPCVPAGQVADVSPRDSEAPVNGSETILLVEDEDAVRRATAEFLTMHGYRVLQARDGLEALAVVKNHGSPIHLAVTDVVMPNMSGGQLAKELSVRCPEAKVLFVSGYAGKTIMDHKVVDLESNFLQKPFTLKELSRKIREVLARQLASSQESHLN